MYATKVMKDCYKQITKLSWFAYQIESSFLILKKKKVGVMHQLNYD